MSEKKLIEKITVTRDERNHLWAFFLVTISGSLALIIQLEYNFKMFAGIVGLILALFLFIIYLKRSIELDKLIEKIEKKES
jgi:hypothetical protein